eukprot:CAMPEP_0119553650 /NCGR_PEP_ID=MMETSP1352-20130426/6360_1 /TAXON_ID=265584 /ORGANISM="Stauroneis constricta, Strain CCMP1120" /LENGTH=99 /DNA_ID=CAMNT_0007600099 /DNA_START=116 /DNA_END=411 /DNA_ORIENTATION=+
MAIENNLEHNRQKLKAHLQQSAVTATSNSTNNILNPPQRTEAATITAATNNTSSSRNKTLPLAVQQFEYAIDFKTGESIGEIKWRERHWSKEPYKFETP